MKKIVLLIMMIPLLANAAKKNGIQNEDVKSLSDITSSVLSTTGNLTISNPCITSLASTVGLAVGQFVYDTTISANIPVGTTIAGLPGTCVTVGQVQMSQNATANATADLITFGGQASQLINDTKMYVTANAINAQLSTAISNGLIGGGGGAKNYLSSYVASTGAGVSNLGNGDFEQNSTNGWSLAHSIIANGSPISVASTGVGFDATHGGSAVSGLTLGIVSSGQIQKKYSASITSSAISTIGDMLISKPFFIDLEDQSRVQQIKFYYSVNSGLANMNFSGTGANTYSIWIYDVTNAQWIQPAGTYNLAQGAGVGIGTATFQTTSNSNQYQLALVNTTASTGAFALYVDDFTIGPQTTMISTVVTDWVPYVPVITGFSIITSTDFYSRRVGDSLEVSGIFTYNSPISVANTITFGYNGVNGNIVADPVKIPATGNTLTGDASGSANSNTLFRWAILAPANGVKNYVQISVQSNGANANGGGQLGSNLGLNTTGNVQLHFKVPILGWSSNAVSSADTDTRVVDFHGISSTNAVYSGTTLTMTYSAIVDTHSAFNGSNTYTIPVSGYYKIQADTNVYQNTAGGGNSFQQIVINNAVVKQSYLAMPTVNAAMGQVNNYEAKLNAGDTVKIQMVNSSGSMSVLGSAVGAAHSLIITRISGPSVVQAAETVAVRYHMTAGESISNNTPSVINYDTKDFDTHGAVTTGAGWIFTAPISGKYHIDFANKFSGNPQAAIYAVYKNGLLDHVLTANITGLYSGSKSPIIMESARISAGGNCSGSPCTISGGTYDVNDNPWVQSANRSGVGTYQITYQPGIFTGQPTCFCSGDITGTSSNVICGHTGSGANNIQITCAATNAAGVHDCRFDLVCMSPGPITPPQQNGSGDIQLKSGDTIAIYVIHQSPTATSLNGVPSYNWISIYRTGN